MLRGDPAVSGFITRSRSTIGAAMPARLRKRVVLRPPRRLAGCLLSIRRGYSAGQISESADHAIGAPYELIIADMARRQAAFLRVRWPRDTEKQVARTVGVSVQTARAWISPSNPKLADRNLLIRMMIHFGAPFVAQVFAPCGDWTAYLDANRALDDIERRIDGLSGALACIPGRDDPRAAAE